MNENENQPYNGQLDEALLTAYALDELEGAERTLVEASLQTSRDAQRTVEEIRAIAGHIRQAAGDDERFAPSADLRALLESRLGSAAAAAPSRPQPDAKPATTWRRHRWLIAAVASAAAILLAVAIPSLPRFQRGVPTEVAVGIPAPRAEEGLERDFVGAEPAAGMAQPGAVATATDEAPTEEMAQPFDSGAIDPERFSEERSMGKSAVLWDGEGEATSPPTVAKGLPLAAEPSAGPPVEAKSAAMRRTVVPSSPARPAPELPAQMQEMQDEDAARSAHPVPVLSKSPEGPGRQAASGRGVAIESGRKMGDMDDSRPDGTTRLESVAQPQSADFMIPQSAAREAIRAPAPTGEPGRDGFIRQQNRARERNAGQMPGALATDALKTDAPVDRASQVVRSDPGSVSLPKKSESNGMNTRRRSVAEAENKPSDSQLSLQAGERLLREKPEAWSEPSGGRVGQSAPLATGSAFGLGMGANQAPPAPAGDLAESLGSRGDGEAGYGGGGLGGYGGGLGGLSGAIEKDQSAFGDPAAGAMGQDTYFYRSNMPEVGYGTEQYEAVAENPFLSPITEPESTVSVDVDTASYANVRRFLENNQVPPPGAVRIEEMINYFRYDYPQPAGEHPFSVSAEVAGCPWNGGHRLVRVGLQAGEIGADQRGPSNLVFLLDVSGSMRDADKLPLVKDGMTMLVDQLTEDDRVSIVTYAGEAGLALEPTEGTKRKVILDRIEGLNAAGSTHGSAGIQMAYGQAMANFVPGGNNRVILCTDGDLNVGVTDDDQLVQLVKQQASGGVFLTVVGVGTGNLKDAKLEKLADNGNGSYAYVDGLKEARKVFIEQASGSLVTVAKDVKIQVEFNPAEVAAYRLIGYENRLLATQDFDNDMKDAGEIGAGHSVTFLYEIVPARGSQAPEAQLAQGRADLRYQRPVGQELTEAAESGELFALKLRYKLPDAQESTLMEVAVEDSGKRFGEATEDFRFAAAVASFGLLLRGSEYNRELTYPAVEEFAAGAIGSDPMGLRSEFVELVRRAGAMFGQRSRDDGTSIMLPSEAAPTEPR